MVPGWTRQREAVRLAQAAFAAPADGVVVEVGSFLGCSTILLAGARKLRGGRKVHAIDSFDASGDAFSRPVYETLRTEATLSLRQRFETNLHRAGVRDWVEIHQARAEDEVKSWTAPIDLLYYDGDHSYDAVTRLYDSWSGLLKDGAILAIHNSQAGYRNESHDGSSRLVEERIHPPEYDDIERVDTLTFARKRGNGSR